jgi:nitrate reductase NapAB chaperone NapD
MMVMVESEEAQHIWGKVATLTNLEGIVKVANLV